MGRAVNNPASRPNSLASSRQGRTESTQNRSASALATASTNIAQLVGMAMMPPKRLPSAPFPSPAHLAPVVDMESDNLPRPVSSSTNSSDVTAVEDAMGHYVNNGAVYGTKVSPLPNGNLKIHIPTGTTHSQLYSYLVFELKAYDLNRVTELNLSFCTHLTGESLSLLGLDFPSLRVLDLTGCSQFQDDDLQGFTNMVHLENLCLAGCLGISVEGFRYLTSLLTKLETLDLSSCPQVNDEFLMLLANSVNPKELTLSGCTGFTGEGLEKIGKSGAESKLRSLTLDQCPQITDADLFKLRTLGQLEQLNIKECPSITKSGIYKLRRHLKHTEIQSDFTPGQQKRRSGTTWQEALPLTKKFAWTKP